MPAKIVRADGVSPVSTLDEGTRATSRLITDAGLDGVTGRYFNRQREAAPDPQAQDLSARRQLRDLSDRLCGPVSSSPSWQRKAILPA